MTTCEVCGTEFDERGVQIVVPGIAKSFDSVDCAVRGRALHGPPASPNPNRPRPVFLEIPSRDEPYPYELRGLPAGLAAAFSGIRARAAIAGASAAVAVVVATTAYLALRDDARPADAHARPPVSPSPPRYGPEDRGILPVVEEPATAGVPTSFAPPKAEPRAWTYAPPTEEDEGDGAIRLVAYRPEPTKPPLALTVASRTEAPKLKATRHGRKAPRIASERKTRSVSTRPGWGRGDKNHAHGGPPKHSAAKAHGRRK